jgi:hypothetical protein
MIIVLIGNDTNNPELPIYEENKLHSKAFAFLILVQTSYEIY